MIGQTGNHLVKLELRRCGRGFDVVVREIGPPASRPIIKAAGLEKMILRRLDVRRETGISYMFENDFSIAPCLGILMRPGQFRVKRFGIGDPLGHSLEWDERSERSKGIINRGEVAPSGRHRAISFLEELEERPHRKGMQIARGVIVENMRLDSRFRGKEQIPKFAISRRFGCRFAGCDSRDFECELQFVQARRPIFEGGKFSQLAGSIAAIGVAQPGRHMQRNPELFFCRHSMWQSCPDDLFQFHAKAAQ